MKYAGVLSAAVATLVVMKYFVMMFGFAGMLCAYQTAPAQDAARILHVDTGFAQNIYKMVTVTDRHGKTKTKKQHTVEEVYVDIPEQHGVIVDARDVSQYAGSNTQYSSPSQACLNNLLCHVISGDPTSSTQAVYQNLAVFTIHTGNLTYVAYDKGATTGTVINGEVSFGILNNVIYLNGSRALTIYQTILDPGATIPTSPITLAPVNAAASKAPCKANWARRCP